MSEAPQEYRIPPATDGFQVNFCKNPLCVNFGEPASEMPQSRGRYMNKAARDRYKLSGTTDVKPQLQCLECNEILPVKSNIAVSEELQRLRARGTLRRPAKSCCPNETCENHSKPVEDNRSEYYAFGKTAAGSKRYQCKKCKTTISISRKSIIKQRKSHVNSILFRALCMKLPFRCAAELLDISVSTVYDKMDFIHKQAVSFAAAREEKLRAMKTSRMYIATDRQVHTLNWTNRLDKRNVDLYAVGSADMTSGYILALHANYDERMSPLDVALDAAACKDHERPPHFRKYARLWLPAEFDEAIGASAGKSPVPGLTGTLDERIRAVYAVAGTRADIERPDTPTKTRNTPPNGMLVHADYTLYAHFFYLRELLNGVEKTRFYMDQESGIRAACAAAFWERILNKDCDAFYVQITKGLPKEARLKILKDREVELAAFIAENPVYELLSDTEVKKAFLKKKMRQLEEFGKWRDKWLEFPFPTMTEPEKKVCYLTNLSSIKCDYDDDHMVNLYMKASLHAIDRFFMQLRRKTALLERPITSAANAGRKWHGYNAYNPAHAVRMMDVYRVYYNFVKKGNDGKTPAMRLGLAKAPLSVDDILYFDAC